MARKYPRRSDPVPTESETSADDLNAAELERLGVPAAEVIPDERQDDLPLDKNPTPAAPQPAYSGAFRQAYPLVLRHEGGFVNHPRDPGGATNLGVSLRYARTRGSLFDLDGDGDVDAEDIRLVTPETAQPFYHDDFWQAVRADDLPPGLGYAVFDAAVNSGPGRAARWLQAAVGATVDGQIGPKTIRAASAATDPLIAIERLCRARMTFLRGLSTWGAFGRGWERRVDEVVQNAMKLARGMRP